MLGVPHEDYQSWSPNFTPVYLIVPDILRAKKTDQELVRFGTSARCALNLLPSPNLSCSAIRDPVPICYCSRYEKTTD